MPFTTVSVDELPLVGSADRDGRPSRPEVRLRRKSIVHERDIARMHHRPVHIPQRMLFKSGGRAAVDPHVVLDRAHLRRAGRDDTFCATTALTTSCGESPRA
jgi:hypothetical protein